MQASCAPVEAQAGVDAASHTVTVLSVHVWLHVWCDQQQQLEGVTSRDASRDAGYTVCVVLTCAVVLAAPPLCVQALMRSDPEAGVAVLVHELTHALGFTDDMFDKFIDESGQPIPKSQVSHCVACIASRQLRPCWQLGSSS
jgi:hypothetical protein